MAGRKVGKKDKKEVEVEVDVDVVPVGFIDVQMDKLVSADWNYKKQDAKLSEKLKENIKRNGMIENLIVRELETGFIEVVNGNHRLDVARELDFKSIHVYNLGKISEGQAKRVAIATNETKFATDEVKLSETLAELQKEFGLDDLALELPYTQEEITSRLSLLNFDWGTEGFAGAGGSDEDGLDEEPTNDKAISHPTAKIKVETNELKSRYEAFFNSRIPEEVEAIIDLLESEYADKVNF